jgi:hypothetical protein
MVGIDPQLSGWGSLLAGALPAPATGR